MFGKTVRVMMLLGVAMFFFASLALARTNTIKLDKDVVLPDGQTLKAGQYTVVVDEKVDQVQFLQGDTVVVKHACKCIPQDKKHKTNSMLFDEPTPGKLVLKEMRFSGETRNVTLPS